MAGLLVNGLSFAKSCDRICVAAPITEGLELPDLDSNQESCLQRTV